MIVLGIHHGHDAGAALWNDYRLLAATAEERISRVKGDGGRFPSGAVDACLKQAGVDPKDVDVVALPRIDYPISFYRARAHLPFPKWPKNARLELMRVMSRNRIADPLSAFDAARWLEAHGLKPRRIFFYNHHAAHALGALFRVKWRDGLVYTSDGGGDRVFASARLLRGGGLVDLFGGEGESRAFSHRQDKSESLALLYYFVTRSLGMTPLRHEGKVMGLAAYGRPTHAAQLRRHYCVDDAGRIHARVDLHAIASEVDSLARQIKREDLAASTQSVVEDVVIEALTRLQKRCEARRLILAGGLFANVRLNQAIAENIAFDEIFVDPAMTDLGQATGGALHFLLERDGPGEWMARRAPLENLYFGFDYDQAGRRIFDSGARRVDCEDLASAAAEVMARGGLVGVYLGRSEHGPRALGARSILASPADRAMVDRLNRRLDRSDFMPFAPVTRQERSADVFDLPSSMTEAARFMTTTCRVRSHWQEQIAAVIHVDGTARPQILARRENELYYDVVAAFERKTGLPAAINTSFNAHEEPIVETPHDALRELTRGRVDVLLAAHGLYERQ